MLSFNLIEFTIPLAKLNRKPVEVENIRTDSKFIAEIFDLSSLSNQKIW